MDDPVTRVTRLPVVTLPAAQAVRHPLHRNVLVAGQRSVAHPAAEVLQVPEPLLRRRELHREDELVTRGAPGDVHLEGEVTAAVELVVTVVIEKVLKQRRLTLCWGQGPGHLEYLPALAAGEAVWVPALVRPRPLRKHGHLPRLHPTPTAGAGPARGGCPEAGGWPLIIFAPTCHNWQQLHRRRHHRGWVLVLVPELAHSALARDVPLDIVNIRAHSVKIGKILTYSRQGEALT